MSLRMRYALPALAAALLVACGAGQPAAESTSGPSATTPAAAADASTTPAATSSDGAVPTASSIDAAEPTATSIVASTTTAPASMVRIAETAAARATPGKSQTSTTQAAQPSRSTAAPTPTPARASAPAPAPAPAPGSTSQPPASTTTASGAGTGTTMAPMPGTVTRQTELRSQPALTAQTLRTLAANTPVIVTARQSGWLQVTSGVARGWVRLLHVSTQPSAQSGSARAELEAAARVATGRAGSGNIAVTTGIRGLDQNDLRDAKPNPEELQRLEALGVEPAEAQAYAARRGLERRSIPFPVAPASR